MKRSPMPPRRHPMSRGKPPERRAPIGVGDPNGSRKGGKAKASRPAGPSAAVVAAVRRRSGGLCEVGLECGGTAAAVERAHRTAKGAGGPGSKGRAASNSPSNLLDVCRRDHVRLDRTKVTGSYVDGFKIRHGVARPHEIPVLHNKHGWVLLDDHGGWRYAPVAAVTDGLLPVVQMAVEEYTRDVAGELVRALHRYGHLDCGGWSFDVDDFLSNVSGALLNCACGAEPFVVTLLEAE
ncbi:hypothetical protein AB0O28_19185 [Microbispora sp. NPDC088329]|uniref:hypothetical protein n=1 Tax=Microbispora sp. NPDC088329 TaxID=3154869 RepID=UPI0034159CDE